MNRLVLFALGALVAVPVANTAAAQGAVAWLNSPNANASTEWLANAGNAGAQPPMFLRPLTDVVAAAGPAGQLAVVAAGFFIFFAMWDRFDFKGGSLFLVALVCFALLLIPSVAFPHVFWPGAYTGGGLIQ